MTADNLQLAQIRTTLTARRRELRLTQRELAIRIARSATWVSEMEQGKAEPSADGLESWARALGM